MIRKLTVLIVALALMAVATVPACTPSGTDGGDGGGGVAKAEYNWRMGYPDVMTTRNESLEAFTHLVYGYSGGRIKVDYMGYGVLGSNSEIFNAVQAGNLEMSCHAPYVDLVPGGMMNWMPWTVSNYRQAAVAYEPEKGIIFKVMDDAWAEVGFKQLFNTPQGAYGIANNIRPLKTPADFDGWKFRVSGSLGFVRTMENMSKGYAFQMETLPWADLYTALETGVVDGYWTIWNSLAQERHFEVVKYYTVLNFGWDTNNAVMNLNLWNSLPADLQEAIKKASKQADSEAYESQQRATLESIDFVIANGLEVYWPTEEERAVFREAANMPVIWEELCDPWLDAKYPGQNMSKQIQDELDRIIAETPAAI